MVKENIFIDGKRVGTILSNPDIRQGYDFLGKPYPSGTHRSIYANHGLLNAQKKWGIYPADFPNYQEGW